MFSEDYKRGVCLDDLDVGLDWNALIENVNFQVEAIKLLSKVINTREILLEKLQP